MLLKQCFKLLCAGLQPLLCEDTVRSMEPNKMLDVKMSTFDRGFEYRTLNISADPRSQILFLRTKISNFVIVNS